MNFFGLIDISDWIIVFFAIFCIIYKYFTWNFNYWKSQNVPSICPIPVFGSLWKYVFEPFPILDKKALSKYGNIWGFYECRNPVLVVANADLIKQITVNDFQHFSSRRRCPLLNGNRLLRHMLPVTNGDEWLSMKNALSITFNSKKLKHMSVLIEESIEAMVVGFSRAIETNTTVNMQTRFEILTAEIVARSCFGRVINCENPSDLAFVNQVFALAKSTTTTNYLLGILFPRLFEVLGIAILPESCLIYFKKCLTQIINMRKQENIKRNDFLQLLLNASKTKKDCKRKGSLEAEDDSEEDNCSITLSIDFNEKYPLSEDCLVANSILFFTHGYDAIANTLSFATYLLALNKKCQEQLSEEIDKAIQDFGKLSFDTIMWLPYLDSIVCETLRLFPPFARCDRRCNSDYKFNNLLIKKEMVVIIPVYAIHHCEDYYPSPEIFDPERFNSKNKAKYLREGTFLPFGVGGRNCLGAKFALIEIKMTLAYFFKRFRVSVAENTEIPLKMKKGTDKLQTITGVNLTVEERN